MIIAVGNGYELAAYGKGCSKDRAEQKDGFENVDDCYSYIIGFNGKNYRYFSYNKNENYKRCFACLSLDDLNNNSSYLSTYRITEDQNNGQIYKFANPNIDDDDFVLCSKDLNLNTESDVCYRPI